MKALIAINGELPTNEFLRAYAEDYELVIATDGAAVKLATAIDVHAICGDFDSIDREHAQRRFSRAALIYMPDQNSSDLEKSVAYARESRATSITFVGGLGGRFDHSMVTLSTMLKLHMEFPVSLVDDKNEMVLLSPQCVRGGLEKFEVNNGGIVSLISLVPTSEVSIDGVVWPLEKHQLLAGSQGVSNRALGGEVSVRVYSGCIALTRPLSPLISPTP